MLIASLFLLIDQNRFQIPIDSWIIFCVENK